MKTKTALFAAALSAAASALAAAGAEAGAETPAAAKPFLDWNAGASLRQRQEVADRIPGAVPAMRGYNNYFRSLLNFWAETGNEDFKLRMRLADEFRFWGHPSRSRSYRFPDELLVDNLYLDLYGLFGGRLDIRAGRQDFTGPDMYGAGLVLCDGTPADGSRTFFFDAIRFRWAFAETEKTDALLIYNNHKTALSWGHPNASRGERELATIWPGTSRQNESGGGLYHRSRTLEDLPFDAYWIYKRESKAHLPGGAPVPGRKVHTFGARLMPKLTETLSGAAEAAFQEGERDGSTACDGAMFDAMLRWTRKTSGGWKPYVQGEFYWLSGDRDRRRGGGNDHAWDPLWARWPQASELMVLDFTDGVGYWSNLAFPSASAGVGWNDRFDLSVRTGPMFAAVRDAATADGRYMGWFSSAKFGFTIVKGAIDGRGDITGYVLGEVFAPGDYYNDGKLAYFLRWQLLFSF